MKADPTASGLAFDQGHVWHPYAALPARRPALPVVAAEGCRLELADGRRVIDGMSSWWSVIHGHGAPEIVAAVHDQLDRMPHVMFGGLTHAPAITLAERLVEMTPPRLDRVFFVDSGSVAVEVALKLCIQYWNGHGQRQRTRMLTVRGGYHGDTFGAMSVCDPVNGMHSMYAGVLPGQEFAPRPPDGFSAPLDPAWTGAVEEALDRAADTLAGVIVEPVVQGAGGMRFHSPACVRFLREACDARGLLLVLDEIATGFGRTGELFAAEHAGVEADVLCVGKALTGGAMSLAATMTSGAVAEAVGRSEPGALMHGPTFMANPLACVAANASLGLLEDGVWRSRVASIAAGLERGLDQLAGTPGVREVRALGAIGVVELEQPVAVPAATEAALSEGVWLRPFGHLIYTMPPYTMTSEELEAVVRALAAATAASTAASG